MRSSALGLVFLFAACSASHGVDVTVSRGSLDAKTVASIVRLEEQVMGVETFSTSYPIQKELVDGTARWIYAASATKGMLDFTVAAFDDAGAVVAGGTKSTELRAGGAASVTITLTRSIPGPDGGVDAGVDGGDAGLPTDSAIPPGDLLLAFPNFVPTHGYDVPKATTTTTAVAIADIDDDGRMDVVATNSDSVTPDKGQLTIALNEGRAGAQPLVFKLQDQPVSVPTQLVGVALADIDEDTKLDIVLADSMTGARILYSKKSYLDEPLGLGAPVNAVVVGDIDGDHHLDIAFTEPAGGVETYLNLANAPGGVVYTQMLGVPTALAMGPIDPASGHLGLAVTDGGGADTKVLLWNISSFDVTSFSTDGGPTGIAMGDLNGAGGVDLVITTYPNAGMQGIVEVYLGDGAGHFTQQGAFPGGVGVRSPVLADLDGDGNLNLLFANQFDMTLSVLKGGGDGTFGPPATISLGNTPAFQPAQVTVGFIDGDARPDIAVATQGGLLVLGTHF